MPAVSHRLFEIAQLRSEVNGNIGRPPAWSKSMPGVLYGDQRHPLGQGRAVDLHLPLGLARVNVIILAAIPLYVSADQRTQPVASGGSSMSV